MISGYLVKWGNDIKGTYRYGAKILSRSSNISYENPLQSPGTASHTWWSQKSFKGNRYSPTLPILVPGNDYYFKFNLKQEPESSINFVIKYYAANNEKIKEDHFEENQGIFNYPEMATHYQIEIINLNSDRMIFSGLWIVPQLLKNELEISFSKLYQTGHVVIASSKNQTKWSLTIVRESVDTTILPIREKENNIILVVKKIPDQHDLQFMKAKLSLAGIESGMPIVIRTFGNSELLQDVKEYLVDNQLK